MTGVAAGADSARSERTRAEFPARSLFRDFLRACEAERDRWFLWVPVLFGAGILLYFQLPSEPPFLLAVMPVLAALALRWGWRHGHVSVLLSGIVLAITWGFGAAKLRMLWVEAPVLERQLYGVEVRGCVEVAEPRATRGQRITLRVTRLGQLDREHRPRRVRVRVMAAKPVLKPGDAIRLKATLSPPSLPALPGDYDFARAAWFSALGGVGYAIARPMIDTEAGEPPWRIRLSVRIELLRQAINERIRAVLGGETGAIASALITGERGGISAATNDAFRDSGLVHILAISGLHMATMAGTFFAAVRLLLAAIPAVALRFPIKKWAAATALIAGFGYLLISGSAISAVRSWIMISIMFTAILLDRPAISFRNVAVAALLILALAPESMFDAGFQMSFAAVVALIAGYEAMRERARERGAGRRAGPILGALLFFGGIILTTLIASIAVAPFGAFHFHKSQQFAVLANLIAIPICNVIVMPAALATLVLMPLGLEAAPLWVMGYGVEAMVWCAYAVAGLPGAIGRVPAISELSFGTMIFGGLWLCIWRRRWRYLGLAVIACGLALTPVFRRPDVLVGHDGQLLAVRGADDRLTALSAASANFELQRWLETDGDARTARAVAGGEGFRCDGVGCTISVKGQLIAFARHASALSDDCERASLVVMPFPSPQGCRPKGHVIDFFAVRRRGTHAIYVDDGTVRITTVAEARGDRPWTRRVWRGRSFDATAARHASRLSTFAAPVELGQGGARPRPEVEDDDGPMIDGDTYEEASR